METAMQVPLDRLLLETDAPDGRPRLEDQDQHKLWSVHSEHGPDDQQLNHPANIRYAPVNCAQSCLCNLNES